VEETIPIKYVSSLYWAITTMVSVGYGDIHPQTVNERALTIGCMIVSSGVFAFIVGDIGKLVGNYNVLAA
jgi:hyperpolarization activated cyclic nucleotide-gated potassium channel 2